MTHPGPDSPASEPAAAAAIGRATGTDFARWVEILDAAGARDMAHGPIAALLVDEHGVDGWWAQSVTVAYEQHIGRREVGQGSTGEYSASVSRTLPGVPDEVFARLEAFLTERAAAEGLADVRTSRTPKRLYWRADAPDGSRVVAGLEPKGEDRTLVVMTQEKLADADARARATEHWTTAMKEFTQR
ncbi:hypothetical protein [Brachybacterium huguangmaarense]